MNVQNMKTGIAEAVGSEAERLARKSFLIFRNDHMVKHVG